MNNLKPIIDQWSRTRSVRMSHKEKTELSNLHKEHFGKGVNTSCASCVMKALDRVAPLFNVKKMAKPKISEVSNKPNEPMDFDNMNMKELRSYANANGIKTTRSLQQQIELIKKSF